MRKSTLRISGSGMEPRRERNSRIYGRIIFVKPASRFFSTRK